MNVKEQGRKAAELRKLHHGPRMLVLPNAWDVASARIVEDLGFPAIATSSAGVAFALGSPDGQRITRDEMLDVVGRIARAVRVPVTADMEAGYGTTVEDMAETAKAVVASGAVGLNLEDVTGDDESTHVETDLQVRKIRAIKEASAKLGVPLVINARTDVYLMPIGPEATRFERTVERLRAYREAGADCLFAPGVGDRRIIEKLLKALQAPLNILASSPGCPPLKELERIGVARVSFGAAMMRATMGLVRRIATELRDQGTYSWLLEGGMSFKEATELLAKSAPEKSRKAQG
jgi:2-methylisocitrate lyase-like PEP mutase family enzyme